MKRKRRSTQVREARREAINRKRAYLEPTPSEKAHRNTSFSSKPAKGTNQNAEMDA